MVLAGSTAAEAMEAVMGTEQLGPDPLRDFEESAATQRDRFGQSGTLENVVSHPLGDLSGERFLRMRVFDVALHAWDLATAIGRDATLDDALVAYVLRTVRQEAPGVGFDIEPCGDVGPDASALEQLLDLSGRCTKPAPA
jgi:uncharacterized protein (TIGR03086 family)